MKLINIKHCPFCKGNQVEFEWTHFLAHGRVVCKNWKDNCCAHGPQLSWKKYDNIERFMNRTIKVWNGNR